MSPKKNLPDDLLKAGVFNQYDGRVLVAYLRKFKRQDEADSAFVRRVKQGYDPGVLTEWENGRQPRVDHLKEIWWVLRHDGCQFSTLIRLAYGFDAKEPEVGEYWKVRRK
jgi:hypothetical protein